MIKLPGASLVTKVCMVIEIVAFIFTVLGFSTPYWRALHFEEYRHYDDKGGRLESLVVIQGFDEGLWRRCVNSICANINVAGRGMLESPNKTRLNTITISCTSKNLYSI